MIQATFLAVNTMHNSFKTRRLLFAVLPLVALGLGGCGSDSNPLPSNFSPDPEPWELFILGDNDPASRLVINAGSAAGVYEFRMTEPDHFSWQEVGEEGQSTQPDKALMLFLKAWHMLYGDEWADGRLQTLDTRTGTQFNLALRLSRPLLDEETQEMVFQARLVSQLSENLKAATPDSGAPLASRMPTGQWKGQTTLWVENATGVPHHRLSEGIKFETRQLPLASTPKGVSLVQDAVAATGASSVVNTDIENPTWPTGDCKNEYLQARLDGLAPNLTFSNWKEFVVAYTKARNDLQAYNLTQDEFLAVARAYLLPCNPVVTDGSPDMPANVALIKTILTKALWDGLTTQMVVNETLTAAQQATFTYDNFLTMAGKYPFFCGEPGIHQLNGNSSPEEACRRDLAAFFAHATQETGAHDPNLVPSGTPYWKQAFAKTREGSCYLGDVCNPVTAQCPQQYVSKCSPTVTDGCPKPCDKYDPDVSAAGGTCPPDFTCSGHYYGRGFMQLSYYFNYLGFGGQILNDPKQFVSNPDLVAQNGLFSLGSAFWFYMSPQPPKPSMHDLITGGGGYHPAASYGKVALVEESYLDWQGNTQTANNPVDKFMVSISVINGGVECSPADKPGITPDEAAQAKGEAINRMQYYSSLLTYLGATLTSLETSYASNTTGCTIENGSPFSTNLGPTSIGYAPRWWLAADSYDKCGPVSWQAQPPLALASEKSREVCLDICGSTCE